MNNSDFVLNGIIECIKTVLQEKYRLTLEELSELLEAKSDGRLVILPRGGYNDKDGENALKSAMHTCYYHNNPVTRYIADAVAEKLTRKTSESVLSGYQSEKPQNMHFMNRFIEVK